jgi:uncharacterized protein YkvS
MYDLNNFKIAVRAWIPKENKMIYSDHDPADYELEGVYFWQFNKFGNLALFEVMDTANEGDPYIEREVKEAVIMPCIQLDIQPPLEIGKRDEVYVGDIIYFDDGYEKAYGIVEYNTDDYQPQFCMVYNYGNIIDFSHGLTKVVGNVFENWDLLDESLV